MGTRPIGACQVQPEWRKKLLFSLPADGSFGPYEPGKICGDYSHEADESEDDDFPDYDAWFEDRMEWVQVAVKEAEFLGQIETERTQYGSIMKLRLTEKGAQFVLELRKPKAVAA